MDRIFTFFFFIPTKKWDRRTKQNFFLNSDRFQLVFSQKNFGFNFELEKKDFYTLYYSWILKLFGD